MKEQQRVAMESPEHLKRWLEASGRKYILLIATDLVDALPWPEGVTSFMEIISCYRDHRCLISTGDFEEMTDPETSMPIRIPVMKTEMPSIQELDRAIRYLIEQASRLDSSWKLENAPL